jgi:proprotein convertase subtilisin/kexin type 5
MLKIPIAAVYLLGILKFVISFDCRFEIFFCSFQTCSNSGCLLTINNVGCFKRNIEQNCIDCDYDLTTCTKCINDNFFLTNAKCSPCSSMTNCKVCSASSGICLECNAGYYSSETGCSLCSSKVSDCSACDITGKCLECRSGYFLQSSTQCAACISSLTTHCSCADNTQLCKTCDVNYFLSNSQCEPCANKANCIDCSPSADKCNECNILYYGAGSECLIQPDSNCLTYQSQISGLSFYKSSCVTCMDGYFPDGGSCVQCSNLVNCEICKSDSKACAKCNIGYFPQGDKCYVCQNILNCLVCNQEKFQCLRCSENYYLYDGYCLACPSSCGLCDGFECQSCASGFTLFSDPSPPYKHCISCSTIPDCETCSITDFACTKCKKGSVSVHKSYCRPCSGNCSYCESTSPYSCNECEKGYFLAGGSCYNCSTKPNCITCDPKDDKCLSCKEGYFLFENICKACDPSCKTCKSLTESCVLCKETYYRDGYTCLPKCLYSKKGMNQNGTLVCVDNCPSHMYTDMDLRLCELCPETCLTCSGPLSSNCRSCKDGFFLSSGVCERN